MNSLCIPLHRRVEETGAEHVIVFHHQIRNKEKNTGTATNLNTPVQGYAEGIHSDSHPVGAEQTFGYLASDLDKKYHKGRFMYVNAWRNISDTPIADNPLAVCDERSLVKPDDYLVSQLFGPGYVLPQFNLNARNSNQHKWYYFSKMKKDEVILFKQWDSDRSLDGRVCFHTAFKDPNAPSDAPTRESIEVRALAFFPNHEPNTMPDMKKYEAPVEEKEKNRVTSKHLFNFQLDGVWDEEVAMGKVKGKQTMDVFNSNMKKAANAKDNGAAIAGCLREFMNTMFHYINQEPYFADFTGKCDHDVIKVKGHDKNPDVPVHVHRPKSLKNEK